MIPTFHRDEGYSEPGGVSVTSGHAGSEASRDRALREEASGTTRQRREKTLGYVGGFGSQGLTVKELRDLTGWHHGQASAVLSNLHKAGSICRVAEQRNGCHLYVMPDQLAGRRPVPFGGKRAKSSDSEVNLDGIDWALHSLDMYEGYCGCGAYRFTHDSDGNRLKDGAAERAWVEHVLGTVKGKP